MALTNTDDNEILEKQTTWLCSVVCSAFPPRPTLCRPDTTVDPSSVFCRGRREELEARRGGQGQQHHHRHEGEDEAEGEGEAGDIRIDQVSGGGCWRFWVEIRFGDGGGEYSGH